MNDHNEFRLLVEWTVLRGERDCEEIVRIVCRYAQSPVCELQWNACWLSSSLLTLATWRLDPVDQNL